MKVDQPFARAQLVTVFFALALFSGFFAVTSAVTPSVMPSAIAAEKPQEAWSFMAFAGPYGRFKAVTTSDTALLDNGVFRYSLQGPRYDLFRVLNPENKSYIQTTVSQYAKQWAPSINYPKLKKIGSGNLLKLECTHYLGEHYKPGVEIDAWFTEAIPMAKGLTDSFCKLCGLPTGYGLPIKVQFISPRLTERAFELLKIEKTQAIAETLVVPKNYHIMKDQALFFLSDEDGKNSGIDEFMRSTPLTPNKKDANNK